MYQLFIDDTAFWGLNFITKCRGNTLVKTYTVDCKFEVPSHLCKMIL